MSTPLSPSAQDAAGTGAPDLSDKAFLASVAGPARRAYERRRSRDAVALALPGLLLVMVAAVTGAPSSALALGAVGVVVAFAFAQRGLDVGDGVPLGLLLGAVPVLASAAGPALDGFVSAEACGNACATLALLGGGTVGALLGERLRRDWRGATLLSTLLIGGLLAPMGCLPLAQGGLLGLALGLAAGTATGFVLSRQTA